MSKVDMYAGIGQIEIQTLDGAASAVATADRGQLVSDQCHWFSGHHPKLQPNAERLQLACEPDSEPRMTVESAWPTLQ